jgi:hypothetical protein
MIGREWDIVVIATWGKAFLETSHSIPLPVSAMETGSKGGKNETQEMNKERKNQKHREN